MGKIFCLMGKSASGKDTIYRQLLLAEELKLKKVVPYTTRPIREREKDGVQYYFVDEDRMRELEAEGRIIELRSYDTVHGIWYYFTVDDSQVDLKNNDYLIIGTPESYISFREYYGHDRVVPIYIELDDGVRLQRALNRENGQKEPKYEEMCRRFLADAADFSEEKLQAAGIDNRFPNDDLAVCIGNITDFIMSTGR
ncbi:MAG: guanylate kinase [Lachnospiraceae bacterium]|nr:guanylate kinase [Lachnospiraceae bacterium]